jgi:hypothetical protein
MQRETLKPKEGALPERQLAQVNQPGGKPET